MTLLMDAYKIPIYGYDIQTVSDKRKLNDNIINFYMQMIVARSKGDPENFRPVYAFSSFFYPNLRDKGYEAIKKWTKNVDIFEQALILIPVHLDMKGPDHWCLATIDMDEKAISYYDSLGGNNTGIALRKISFYLQKEHFAKKGRYLDLKWWKQINAKNIPLQKNGSDCGVFTCMFAEYLSRGAEFTFDHSNMPYFRKRIIYEISRNELLIKVPIPIKDPKAISPNHFNYTHFYERPKEFDWKPMALLRCMNKEKRLKYLRWDIEETKAMIEQIKAKQEEETSKINVDSLTWELQNLQEEEELVSKMKQMSQSNEQIFKVRNSKSKKTS